MKTILAVLVAVFGLVGSVFADVYVQGYTRRDGTYVAPHYRSSPNSSTSDNWSTRGNYNPYTGERGTRSEYNDMYKSNSKPFGQGVKPYCFGSYCN